MGSFRADYVFMRCPVCLKQDQSPTRWAEGESECVPPMAYSLVLTSNLACSTEGVKRAGGKSGERIGTARHVVSQARWVHRHRVLKCLKGFKINKSCLGPVSAVPVGITQHQSRKQSTLIGVCDSKGVNPSLASPPLPPSCSICDNF